MKKVMNGEYHRTGALRQNTKVLSDRITECDHQLLDMDMIGWKAGSSCLQHQQLVSLVLGCHLIFNYPGHTVLVRLGSKVGFFCQ